VDQQQPFPKQSEVTTKPSLMSVSTIKETFAAFGAGQMLNDQCTCQRYNSEVAIAINNHETHQKIGI